VIAEGPPQTVATDPAVIDAYLGTDHAARHAPVPLDDSAADAPEGASEESKGGLASQ
jgi:hypothetical protein